MIDFRERVKINNINMPKKMLTNYVTKLRSVIKSVEKISTFEIITAIAFKYFADQKVDIALIEVGMGGRLDATNVVKPIVSVISPVSHDHMKILGNTIAKIAEEKAGIIKESVPVILSPQKRSAKEAIERIATKKGHYGIIYEFVKAKFLCRDCNPFKTNYYGNIPSLLLIKTGKRTGGVFTLIKEGDGDDK